MIQFCRSIGDFVDSCSFLNIRKRKCFIFTNYFNLINTRTFENAGEAYH